MTGGRNDRDPGGHLVARRRRLGDAGALGGAVLFFCVEGAKVCAAGVVTQVTGLAEDSVSGELENKLSNPTDDVRQVPNVAGPLCHMLLLRIEELSMSVTGWVLFADWEELQRQFRDDPDWSKARRFDEEMRQEDDWWPARFHAEEWNPGDWIGSWNAAWEASRQYDRLRKGLDAGTRGVLDRIAGAFFWEGGSAPPDIPGFRPYVAIGNVLGPQTVEELAGLAESLDLEALREPFWRRCRPEPSGWIRSFEDFRDYLKQWLDMLRGARGSGKAVVLWVA